MTALALSACSATSTSSSSAQGAGRAVLYQVAADSMEQRVLAELYSQSLRTHFGRLSMITIVSNEEVLLPTEVLMDTSVDVVVGCTGNLLQQLNPLRAEELVEDAEAGTGAADDPNDPSFGVEVYSSLMKSLPPTVTAVDQSGAQGCADTGPAELTQNVLPLFKNGVFSREELFVLDSVNKLVTTEALADMVARSKEDDDAHRVVTEFLGNHNGVIVPEPA